MRKHILKNYFNRKVNWNHYNLEFSPKQNHKQNPGYKNYRFRLRFAKLHDYLSEVVQKNHFQCNIFTKSSAITHYWMNLQARTQVHTYLPTYSTLLYLQYRYRGIWKILGVASVNYTFWQVPTLHIKRIGKCFMLRYCDFTQTSSKRLPTLTYADHFLWRKYYTF